MTRLIIMMLAAGTAFGQATDPGGWSKAKWGMTEEQQGVLEHKTPAEC